MLGADGMSVNESPVTAVGPPRRVLLTPLRVAAAAVLVLGLTVGGSIALLHRSSPAAPTFAAARPLDAVATWPAGKRPAPGFRLVDQHGVAYSLRSLRGRNVIVTFMDPLCRSLCPLEARTLMQAERSLPPAQRPAIVAVSVNPWGNTQAAYREDASHWRLDSSWRWAVGPRPRLARVWRDYDIGVQFLTRTISGVTIHDVTHTEAAYLVDSTGHERALLLYPFRPTDVLAALKRIS